MVEVSVKVSNDEARLTQKYVCYDTNIVVSKEDLQLSKMVDQAVSNFNGDVDDVIVVLRMQW